MARTTNADLMLVIEELRSEVRTLSERLARLEAGEPPPAAVLEMPVPPSLPTVPEESESISEEILLVISAAVAAFLGERAHVRQVRLVRSGAWAQQGRVSIQASHHLQH